MIFKSPRTVAPISHPNSPIRHSAFRIRHCPNSAPPPPRRASVLILVVAVLALLVLMGTAYLVSARTDRANATAMSNSNNVDLARDAVMSTVVQTIGSSMLDSAGNVGGYDATTGTYKNMIAGTATPQAAHIRLPRKRHIRYKRVWQIVGEWEHAR